MYPSLKKVLLSSFFLGFIALVAIPLSPIQATSVTVKPQPQLGFVSVDFGSGYYGRGWGHKHRHHRNWYPNYGYGYYNYGYPYYYSNRYYYNSPYNYYYYDYPYSYRGGRGLYFQWR